MLSSINKISNKKLQRLESDHIIYPIGQRQIHDCRYHNVQSSKDWGEYNESRQFLEQIDVENLKRAYRFLFERHESLRTAFPLIEGERMQKVYPYSEEDFGLKTFTVESFEELEEIIRIQKFTLADLQKSPLAFGLLFYNKQSGYLFTFHIHHIIADNNSMAIIRRELMEFYQAFQKGYKPQAPNLNMQLGEYICIQNEKEEKEQGKKYRFWTEKLTEFIKPVDHTHLINKTDPRALVKQNLSRDELTKVLEKQNGAEYEFSLEKESRDALVKGASQAEMSSITIFLTALRLLLYLENNETRPLIAIPVSGRFNQASVQLIGNLMGGIYMAREFKPEEPLKVTLKQDLVEYFENLDHIIYNHDFLNQIPLRACVDLALNYQKIDAMSGTDSEEIPMRHTKTQVYYALELFVFQFKDKVAFKWKYNTDLLSPNSIESLSGTYLDLLKTMLVNIELPVKKVIEMNSL